MVPQKPGIAFVDFETEAQARLVPHRAHVPLRAAALLWHSEVLRDKSCRRVFSHSLDVSPRDLRQATIALMGLNGFKLSSTHSLNLSYQK